MMAVTEIFFKAFLAPHTVAASLEMGLSFGKMYVSHGF